ncbi:helix-turn-helix domain-containing protein [Nocardia sp. NPDC005745]|uniref:helix-turn-helix domain-containing protein n=1 Tax=Nocardia sp. NPDC005745 TaxID=3157061 RepID=UPI0033F1BACD
MRSTLHRYLELDQALARVAAAEHISKNTVTYRVRRALSLCGHEDSSTNTRAALRGSRTGCTAPARTVPSNRSRSLTRGHDWSAAQDPARTLCRVPVRSR